MICCFTVKSFMNMSLPTAGMVIGWVSTVINILQFGVLMNIDDLRDFARSQYHSVQLQGYLDNGSSVGYPVFFSITFLDLIASILLVVGVNKKNHLFLLPWLINNALFLFFRLLLGITLIALVSALGDENPHFPGGFLIVLIVSVLVFLCMVWNAVYSLFQSIRKSNERAVVDEERLIGNPNIHCYELFKNPE